MVSKIVVTSKGEGYAQKSKTKNVIIYNHNAYRMEKEKDFEKTDKIINNLKKK